MTLSEIIPMVPACIVAAIMFRRISDRSIFRITIAAATVGILILLAFVVYMIFFKVQLY